MVVERKDDKSWKRVSMRPIFHSFPFSLITLSLLISTRNSPEEQGDSLKMAQRTEKEETEFKVLDTLTTTTTLLCVNNCGVVANPATNNMCQKCFNASIVTAGVDSGSSLKRSARSVNIRSSTAKVVIRNREIDPVKRDQQILNRCSGCRKKVGLTGFRCRCGELFCAEHRYSDRHDCSYDYKTAGREAIARENPVVKAAKMVKV